jgi:hypothetical protein
MWNKWVLVEYAVNQIYRRELVKVKRQTFKFHPFESSSNYSRMPSTQITQHELENRHLRKCYTIQKCFQGIKSERVKCKAVILDDGRALAIISMLAVDKG